MAKPSCNQDDPRSCRSAAETFFFPQSVKKPDHLQSPASLLIAEKPHQLASEGNFIAPATSERRTNQAFFAFIVHVEA